MPAPWTSYGGNTPESQKVPGMVVLHCNGRTYGNDYLLTFKVGPLVRAHTCSIYPAVVGSTCRRLPLESSGVRPSHSIWCPLWLRIVSPWCPFSEKKQPIVTRSDIRKYGGWVMTGIAAQQAMCGSVRYRDAETTVPATGHAACSELYHSTSAELAHRNDQWHCPGGRNSWCTKPSMSKNSGNFLTTPRRTQQHFWRPVSVLNDAPAEMR
jgi:hypothetical protein